MTKEPRHNGTTRGFSRAAGLMQDRIRTATESRGFAVSRLLTHWAEVVGPDLAAVARPVEVTYGRGGMGATLVLLTTGPQAPMLEMQKEKIREQVNACYGYNAISRVRITQTAPTGFAEGQAVFTAAPRAAPVEIIIDEAAQKVADGVTSADLRLALARLAANVHNKHKSRERK